MTKKMFAFIIGGISFLMLAAPVKADSQSHVEKILSKETFDKMFPHRNYYLQQPVFPAYKDVTVHLDTGEVIYNTPGVNVDYPIVTYEGLIEAAKNFPDFCNNGSEEANKRELAAFLGNASQETTVGWGSFDEDSDRFTYGLGLTIEGGRIIPNSHQQASSTYPPSGNKSYQGRGALQLSYNPNYGMFSDYKTGDKNVFLKNPDIIGYDPELFWESAIWFWMHREREDITEAWNKPSCHDALLTYKPSKKQKTEYGTEPGYALTIIAINGGVEGRKNFQHLQAELEKAKNEGDQEKIEALEESIQGLKDKVLSRKNFYKRYCKMLGVEPTKEDLLDPLEMAPFPQAK